VALLWLFGEKLFLTWTNNSIKFDDIFFKGMILVTIIVTISKTFSVLLLATNNHNKYTIVFLISQIFIVTLTYITLKFISPDINIIPVIIFFAEILVLVYTSKEVHKIFNYNFKSIIKFNK
jgi:O-antigen/teichoic acid export membrane protein